MKNKKESITLIRYQLLSLMAQIENLDERESFLRHKWKRKPIAAWSQIQLLSEHSNPQSVLFLGATLGDEIIGAVKKDLRVCVVDRDPMITNTINCLSDKIIIYNSLGSVLEENNSFDIVYVSPWWIVDTKSRGEHIETMISKVLMCTNNNGILLMHFMNDNFMSKTFSRLYIGKHYKKFENQSLMSLSIKKIDHQLRDKGLQTQIMHIMSSTIEPKLLISNQANHSLLVEKLIKKKNSKKATFRAILMRIFLRFHLPLELVFPWVILSAQHIRNLPKTIEKPLFLKSYGTSTITSISTVNSELKYIRHDLGDGKVLYENKLLTYLSTFNNFSQFINPPEEVISLKCIDSVYYKFVLGFEITQEYSGNFLNTIVEIISNLTQIPPPEFLTAGIDYFFPLLEKSKNHFKGTIHYSILNNGVKALERLNDNHKLNWFVHGSCIHRNLRMTKENKSILIVDWIKSHKGHPLWDYWTYLYSNKSLPNYPQINNLLRLEYSLDDLDDLWMLFCAWERRNLIKSIIDNPNELSDILYSK